MEEEDIIERKQENEEGETKKIRRRRKKIYQTILQQMEFYFSDANLSKDRFLRKLIEDDPYVDLKVFLKFNKIRALTDNVDDIANAISKSELLTLSSDRAKVFRQTPVRTNYNEEECSIYVENLPPDAKHEWLKDIFSVYGKVAYVSIPKHKHSGKIKGFAFVEFESQEAANTALEAYGAAGCLLPADMAPEQLCSVATFEPGEGKNQVRMVENLGNKGSGCLEEKEENVKKEAKKEEMNEDDINEESSGRKKKKRKKEESDDDDKIKENVEAENQQEAGDENESATPALKKRTQKRMISGEEENDTEEGDKEEECSSSISKKKRKKGEDENEEKQTEGEEEKERSSSISKDKKKRKKGDDESIEQQLEVNTEAKKPKLEEESSSEKENPEEQKEKKKKGRKNRNKHKNEKLADEAMGLRVLSKREWKRLRNKYLNLQRKNMKNLRMQIMGGRWGNYWENNPDDIEEKHHEEWIEEDNKIMECTKENGSETNNDKEDEREKGSRVQYTAGVIMKIQLKEPLESAKKFKAEVKNMPKSSTVAYIDAKDAFSVVYIRCETAEGAKDFMKKLPWEDREILEGEEEKTYWDKILEDRNEKFTKKIRVKQRGRDKILKKAENLMGKHIRYEN